MGHDVGVLAHQLEQLIDSFIHLTFPGHLLKLITVVKSFLKKFLYHLAPASLASSVPSPVS